MDEHHYIPATVLCGVCDGLGHLKDSEFDCPVCDGTGEVDAHEDEDASA
jgi:RecJ-like exonuclease